MSHAALGLPGKLLDLFRHLPRRRRSQAAMVVVLMHFGALAELLTLGALIPFLAVIADPSAARPGTALGAFMAQTGIRPGASLVPTLAGLFCVMVMLSAIMRLTLAWASQKLIFSIGYDLGVAVYGRILYQDYPYHLEHNSSAVASTMAKIPQIVHSVLLPLMQALTAVIISAAILIGLILINPGVATGAALAMAALYVLVSLAARRKLDANSVKIATAYRRRTQIVQEGIGGIRDVIIDHAQPVFLAQFRKVDSGMRSAQAANALIAGTPRIVIEAIGMVMIILVALTMIGRDGGLPGRALPVLGALVLGAQRLLPLLQSIYNGWTQLVGNAASITDINLILNMPIALEMTSDTPVSPPLFTRTLEFRNVSFRHSGGSEDILSDVSFTVKKGARVGIMGKSGSGKSTTLDLMMGLLTPTSGEILVDGRVLKPDQAHSWQAQIAHVAQAIFLSDCTFFENIAFGVPREKIDEHRARRAAALADIADFIEAQPLGFETVVGERGIRISGGQRQRIGIARALYKRANVLIFDEATSALDDVTEASVMRSIRAVGKDLTLVMVAHRLTTLRDCDVIFHVSGGRIAGADRSQKSLETLG